MDYLYILQTIKESAPSFMNYFFYFISEILIKAAVVIVAVIYWCLNKNTGIKIIFSYSCALTINQTIKNIFCIPRPWILDSRIKIDDIVKSSATGYSFPSNHTVTAASIFGGISIWQKKHTAIVIISTILTILVAFSRNWFGCHTLKDVIVAILVAGFSLCFTWILFYQIQKNIQTHKNLDIIVFIIGTLISLAILLFVSNKNYPLYPDSTGKLIDNIYDLKTDCFTACGMTLGALLGWILERRFVNFEIAGTKKQIIIRSIYGISLFGATYLIGSVAFNFMGEHISHLVKYFLLMFIVVFVYPAIFTKVEKIYFNKTKNH